MTKSEVGKTALGVLAALLLAFSFPAEAQQTGKVARIGYLAVNSPSLGKQLIEAFQQGLRGLGWVDGQNLISGGAWPRRLLYVRRLKICAGPSVALSASLSRRFHSRLVALGVINSE